MAGIAVVIVAMATVLSAFRSTLYGYVLASSVRKTRSAKPLLAIQTIWLVAYCCAFGIGSFALYKMLGWNTF